MSHGRGGAELTPNQVVAFNLRRARLQRGWTQEQAALELEPFLGERWSKVTFSAAERSAAGGRGRRFDADGLVAFALAFDLPVAWFLTPPPGSRLLRPTGRSKIVLPAAALAERGASGGRERTGDPRPLPDVGLEASALDACVRVLLPLLQE